ncbi:MAG: hypothetical protein HDT36_03695 [Clostridiales bacterium]|nr:hypothetical protein [Clostridiales bacterium]
MIRFNGNYSDESLGKNTIRRYRKFLILGIVGTILATVVAIAGWKFQEYELFIPMCISIPAGVCLIVLSIVVLVDTHIRMPKPYVDLQIDDELISFNDGISSKEMQISDVVKVKDLKYGYYIYFAKKSAMKSCVCQKDLLVEGSLEDFEKLFKNKLVRNK